jgi:hypothetical protein
VVGKSEVMLNLKAQGEEELQTLQQAREDNFWI